MIRKTTLGLTCLLAMAGISSALFAIQPAATTSTFAIDSSHSTAIFRTTHLNIGASWGRVNDPAGTFTSGADSVSFDVTLDVAKIDTDNAKRDEHLRNPDFFNAAQFPTMTFKSTSAKKAADGSFDVTGDLTIKGVTKSITVNMKKIGEGKDPWGKYRAGYETEFTINRMDYGVDYMPDGLGKDVKIIIALEGIQQ